ncbi:MAG: rhamnulokinase family protein [Ruthenibacterium sp.]
MKTTVLAFDFGASGGRAIKAIFENNVLSCEEVHRFENIPITQNGHLRWDMDALLKNISLGVEKAGACDSMAFDTWGIDFGLLDAHGKLMENPVHYRDTRTRGMAAQACLKIPAAQLYRETGNQIMDMNTLFQLLACDFTHAHRLLFMPDLCTYLLCGKAVCEYSVASTSQMLNPSTKIWSENVLRIFNIPQTLFAPFVTSPCVVGTYQGTKVIAVSGHDTQCAVTAMPAQTENAAFLSCGTWSLLGTELDAPILTERSKRMELSNEIGANGTIHYLKNIVGLWLLQESRRAWRRGGHDYTYAELERLATEATPLRCFIDPDAPEFVPPGDMPARVQAFCQKTGQPVPRTTGEIVRCIYESLALKYSSTLVQLQKMTGKHFSVLHILGGGAKDRLLCQMSANSCNLPVIAGPTEATALGNVVLQLIALGQLTDVAAGRKLIADTQTLTQYLPQNVEKWEHARKLYQKFI